MSDRTRFFFDGLSSAASGLIEVLQFARTETDLEFEFGPMKAKDILKSGLWLDGDLGELPANLNKIPGATEHRD